jgi:hypothetical protein
MTHPETSIVIRTFNEERDLPRLLEAIHEQRYKDFEVIDVDSALTIVPLRLRRSMERGCCESAHAISLSVIR